MQQITLSGDALIGVGPARMFATYASLPQKVCLGRLDGPDRPPNALPMGAYFSPGRMTVPPPASINRRDKAAASIARMYLNDQLGDCVVAGKMHQMGVWSANDSDSGGTVLATDNEVRSQYQSICGPGDNGCVITDVLDHWRDKGLVAGNEVYKIDGYVSVDWTNKLKVQVAQYIFGATSIGINLPSAWTSAAVWDVTNTSIVGGHDVTPIDYDDQGVYVSSWGRIYLITWAAFMSRRWLSEYYATLAPLWYGNDKLAPTGFDVTRLRADLEKFKGGGTPDLDPPVPDWEWSDIMR